MNCLRPSVALLAGASLILFSSFYRKPAVAAQTVDYAKDIQPIFRASCYSCHQGEKASAGLHLDSKAALAGGVSGKVILPGNSKDSPLLKRLTSSDARVRMPFGGTPLPPEKIELIREWIDQGASWPDDQHAVRHWAYVKPVRPAVPKVADTAWVRNPVDAFVLARLEKEGLRPSPEAAKETLIRRVSLDLTGLPPTIAEIDQFLADQSPDAYEKLVDRLLASPHYGERWALPWLDLARYADTNGFEADRKRSIWKYRDWVIDALNHDMPFDRFTIEQIAGDMLPNATDEDRIATGFNRNTMFNEEGGVDRADFHWQYLVDRVNTTATVWLGTTLGCAQCHDHKYDPFTQKDYYRFLAFFNNSDMGSDEDGGYVEAKLELPTAEQAARRKKLKEEIDELQLRMKTPTPELAREQQEWERSVLAAAKGWTTLVPSEMSATGGTTLAQQADGTILASGANPSREVYEITAKTGVRGVTGIRVETLPDKSLPRGGPGRDAYGNFFLKAFEVDAAPAKHPDRSETVAFQEIVADNGKIKDKKFQQLWSVDASREDERLARQIVFVADTPFGAGETLLHIRLRQDSEFSGQNIGRFRISVTSAADPTTIVTVSHKLRALLTIPESARTAEQNKELADYYRSTAPSLKAARRRLTDARKELEDLGIVSTLVMRDKPSFERPSTYIRIRGAYLSKGDLVYANTPAVLPPLGENDLPNRLGLARWLVSRDNPLTARVAVNRFWEQIFGRGIVETSEDFGTQGALPTHPKLLDWLAVEFMEPSARGHRAVEPWSMKAIVRLLVTSATYRQSSKITPQLQERDPYNRLLARGPRFRLEAELIRDLVLDASGLLSPKIGGPSVFPSQPEGVWDLPYNDEKWEVSKGEDRYRRALYTFLRRTAPYPAFLNFDATSREICTVRRVRTNTPLQALTALNDPAFFEAAQALARRISVKSEPQARAKMAFRLCMARTPNPGELDRMLSWEQKEENFFEQHREDAKRMTGAADPDLAAWTMLSNVLLNLDETMTKE
ncbi:MAG TPA: PSD1 and planctomycete cytochrome C domain-containing protein [Bryobacteraceae bacterium]|nr:PSD1 and planctomycete cytochrome C domain-containing protein [Bryobacteraceae bacterium]